MEPECKDITRVVLPAVRASVAEALRKRYKNRQEEIAQKIGVVQVAVSKYLHGKHSGEITKMKDYITEHRLNEPILDKISNGRPKQEIEKAIEDLCERLIAANVA